MAWPEDFDDRYTAREQAIVDFLTETLDPEMFETSRLLSASTSSGEVPFIVLVRFLGTKTASSPTTNRHTDINSFEIVGIPLATTDDLANGGCNYIKAKIIEAIRTSRAHEVFAETGGKSLLWYVVGSTKGDNDEGDLVTLVQVEAEFQEDYSKPVALPKTVLFYREQAGQEVSVSIEGPVADEYEMRSADGTIITSPADYTGTDGTGTIRVLDEADLTKLERVKLDVKGPTAASKTVPDCAALTEAAANLAITAAGLTPDSDGAFSATVAKGLVINQSPAAGTAMYAGDVVTITVSFGVEYKVVPVTKDLLPAAAEAALVAAGLVLGTSTSEMTDDTEAGLVASSSPAAGTGVAAGSAVDLVVSLGDRHYEIPVYTYAASALSVAPITAFDWVHPDGTVQNGLTCTYAPARGSGQEIVYIRCKAGKTVADITSMQNGAATAIAIKTEDCIYLRPTGNFYNNNCFMGDIANLKDVVASGTASFYLFTSGFAHWLNGSINSWEPIKWSEFFLYQATGVTGSLKFVAGATTKTVSFSYTSGPSYAEFAQTIINWDNCNAASFARTGNFNQYKRSLIGAANPAAEAAIVSLIAKGTSFTFLAE